MKYYFLLSIALLSITTFSFAQKNTATKKPAPKASVTKVAPPVTPSSDLIDEETLSTGYITNTVNDTENGSTIITLTNRATVILKVNKAEKGMVSVAAKSGSGLSSVKNNNAYFSAKNAVLLFNELGYGRFSKTSLEKTLAGSQIKLTPFINEYTSGVSGTTPASNLKYALQLLHLYFNPPPRDENKYQELKENFFKNAVQKNISKNIFEDSIQLSLYNYPAKMQPLSSQTIGETFIYDSAYNFYKSTFANAENFVFTIVGDINIDAVKPMIEKYIGSLNTNEKTNLVITDTTLLVKTQLAKTFKTGNSNVATARLVFSNYSQSEYSNIEAEQLKIFERLLLNKLNEFLPQKFQNVSNIKVSAELNRFPIPHHIISINYSAPPATIKNVTDNLIHELMKISEGGFSQAAITFTITEYNKDLAEQKKKNAYWQNNLQEYLYNTDTYSINKEKKSALLITTEKSKLLAGKYLDYDTMHKFIQMPAE